jgi:hypothetical protein
MTERLDQIEAQQAINTANIADLITLSGNLLQAAQMLRVSVSENAEAIAELRASAAETDQRFNILIAEIRADRQAFQAQFTQLKDRVDDLEAS